MKDVLVSLGLDAALKPQSFAMSKEDYVDMQVHVLTMIQLHLSPKFVVQVLSFDSLIKFSDWFKEMYNSPLYPPASIP